MGSGASMISEGQDLINKMKSNDASTRNDAVKKLLEYVANKEYRQKLGEESTGFIQGLVYVFKNCNDKTCLENAGTCAWWLASEHQFRNALGSERNGLMPVIINYIGRTMEGGLATSFLNILLNCSLDNTLHDYWFSIGLPDFCADLYHKNPDHIVLCRVFRNLLKDLTDKYFNKFMSFRIHEIAIETLRKGGTVAKNWKDRVNGCLYYSLILMVDFLSYPEGTARAKSTMLIEYMYNLLNSSGSKDAEGLRAAYCLAFLVGREEGNSNSRAILESHPQVVTNLIDVFDFTLEKKSKEENTGIPFGIFTMRVITSGLKALSISDANKRILVGVSSLLRMLEKTLQLYVEDREQLVAYYNNLHEYAGGGGNDTKTAENTIELLLQLSFYYQTDEELRRNYMTSGYKFVDLLERIVGITGPRSVSTAHKQQANTLLNRLDEKRQKKLEQAMATVHVAPARTSDDVGSVTSAQHVMISYAWGANKPHVIALANQLRQMGYDIWRDEEGSSIVGPMSGNIDDVMADAIQRSYAVIICVSPQYKDSVNCRSEAKYCQARVHTANLKIIYVMMDANYHTRSSPQCVDGWLGFMVGTELWYRLWDASFVNEAAQSIAGLLGNNAKKGVGGREIQSHAVQQQPAQQQQQQQATNSRAKDYHKAYQILTDANCLTNASRVSEILNELGLTEENELEYLEQGHIDEIIGLMKPIKKNTFLQAMGLK